VQVAVVIVFATVIEYAFAAWLGVYEYRLGGLLGVPAFVPPGHGLVYLAALLFARLAFVQARERLFVALTIVAGGAYALWGLFLSPQFDALGAFWFACLVGFLLWGPSRLLYVGAFVVVTYLEIVGTKLGVWEWQTEDFTGIVAIGNPPSGAAGGYGWFDLTAVLLAPVLMRSWERFRRRRRGEAPLLRYPSDPARH
jgi:hypothetical protein